jgi:nucleoid-associated protein YgaU
MLRKRRWLRWLLLAAILGTSAALPAFGGREGDAPETPPPLLLRVEYGDSLWTIAREYGDPKRDVREVVAAIRRANGVDPGRLQPGATIAIPREFLSSFAD